MSIALLLCRIAAASVFAISGVAKLADVRGTQRALIDFGVNPRLIRIGAVALPLAELATMFALLATSTAWWGAIAAIVLLALFSIAIAVNIHHGRAPDCHCFGQLRPQPVSAKTLVRNGVLALPALFVLIAGRDDAGPSLVAWLGNPTRIEIALALGLAVALLALRRLSVQQRELAESVRVMEQLFDARDGAVHRHAAQTAQPVQKGLPIGAVAPSFAFTSTRGRSITCPSRRPMIAFFASPTCGPCKELFAELDSWRARLEDRFELVVFLRGSEAPKLNQEFVLLGESNLPEIYRATWTPAAVSIDAHGRIASETAFGIDAIRALLTSPDPQRDEVRAPNFKAITPDGAEVSSADLLRDRAAVVLFWSHTCPYCAAIVPDLERWSQQRPPRSPNLILVHSGSDDFPPQRFGAPVVFDGDRAMTQALHSAGTPSAVLIETDGTIVSPVAVGGEDVRALLGIHPES
ncbi:MAG TPA: MauE/DoxX family redox-associated membrane protein [Thermoanaerobaculia bacterium]